MASEMHRLVHTLKGDARLVEYHDVNLVCQKLEDLLAVAAERRYRVSDELDLVVTMALDFIGILLRRKGDQKLGGIDLPGFVAQVKRALGQVQIKPSFEVSSPEQAIENSVTTTQEVPERVSYATRLRLATAATNTFLEYVSASGHARTRLRSIWLTLRGEIERFESLPLAPLLERHLRGASQLATSLGKKVRASYDLAGQDLRVSARALEALDVSLVHLLRNAIDHGIEDPKTRVRQGKAEAGRIAVFGSIVDGQIELQLSDDGKGVDTDLIRRRSSELGLLHPDVANSASDQALFEVLFQPRFSTRERADDLSGRGVGLDAVRSALLQVGASVSLTATAGQGAVVTLRIPGVIRRIEVQTFEAFGGRFVLAIPASWKATLGELTTHANPLDPLASLSIRTPDDETGMLQGGTPKLLTLIRGNVTVKLIASKPPRPAVADRICQTPDSFPAEVVAIGGTEVLLLRPEHLPVPANDSNEW
jgi:two-component system chemotaxis sensor kinase CheA